MFDLNNHHHVHNFRFITKKNCIEERQNLLPIANNSGEKEVLPHEVVEVEALPHCTVVHLRWSTLTVELVVWRCTALRLFLECVQQQSNLGKAETTTELRQQNSESINSTAA